MQIENFDRILWRINGTLLLLACMGGLLIIAYSGYRLMREAFRSRPTHDVVSVDGKTQKKEFLQLGYFEALEGTDFYLSALATEWQGLSSIYSENYGGKTRNFLVFNSKSKKSYWVLKDDHSLIFTGRKIDSGKIYMDPAQKKDRKVKGISFELVENDTNGDGVIDERDSRAIVYLDLASGKLTRIVESVDRTVGIEQPNGDELLVFYSKGGKSYFTSFDLAHLKSEAASEIARPN